MTDFEIIHKMMTILRVHLVKLKPGDIEKREKSYADIKLGYSLDDTGAVTGLRLVDIVIRPVLEIIGRLQKVTRLNMASCRLEQNDILFLRHKENLTHLNICYNKRIQDFSFLRELKGLTSVDLSENKLSDVSFLRELKGLTSVDLSENKLTDVSFLQELKGLTSVDLSGNKLTDVSFLRELKGLTSVYLFNNNLTDVSFLRELKGLTSVYLSDNNLTDVSFLRELKGLTSVYLSNNKLTDISFVSDLDHLTDLYIDYNHIKNPPPEIVKKGLSAIKDYFRSLKKGTEKKLNEVKILLVGDGGAGKTSFFKQLNGETFNDNESKTHGVNINTINYDILLDNQKTLIKTHFWDFGGQEIMHASHQFFLSSRSLYILVLDSRKDDKIEYWLNHIESFGGNSPVMIVINKIDDHPAFDLDRFTLKQKYKNIHDFYRVSCKHGTGVADFKKALKETIPRIELLQIPVAESWFKVKEKLEAATLTKHYIDQQQFQAICQEEHIHDESSRTTLIEFLNELGIVLHFKELLLSDFHVLNPRWVTEAVYKIINSQYMAEHLGILDTRQLNYILNEETSKTKAYDQKLLHITYLCGEQGYILSLMEHFQLCYRLSNQHILIPDLLQKNAPFYEIDQRDLLHYIVQYDFLPANVISRFIVRMHQDIKDGLQWRFGVVLEDKDLHTTAVVKADEHDRQISILVSGNQKRDYFATIRKTLREINASFKQLEVKELVPLPDTSNEFVDYQELIGLERMREEYITIGKLGKKYPVKQLLDGIESEIERKQQSLDSQGRDIYNFYDSNIHLQKIEEVDKMSNQQITFGNDATIQGDFVVAEKIRNSFNKIETSPVSDELKTLLKDLSQAVSEMAEKMDKEKAEEVLKDFKTFIEEAASQKPRKKWWQLSAEGIKEAAQTVGQLGVSVVMNLDKIVPILNKLG